MLKTLLVEGWRGINHSFAMVNQYQLIELLRQSQFDVRHNDMSFLLPEWHAPENDPRFPPDMEAAIRSIPPLADHDKVNVLLRIAFPFARSEIAAKKTVTFMVNERGMVESKFAPGQSSVDLYVQDDDQIVTPSNWARTGLLEYGFPEEKVHVVPHGVSDRVFFPLDPAERREVRDELEIRDEEFVFLNVGALSQNKGIDCLLHAFSVIRQRHANARLMLKDASGLFPYTLAEFVNSYVQQHGAIAPAVAESIYQAPSSLSLADMRRLFGAMDAYVSPYRGEGFNLPVIEAIACGTPAIVTAGGATDDYCAGPLALKVMAEPAHVSGGRGLEPDLESLVEQMESAMMRPLAATREFADARESLVARYSWAKVVERLTEILR